MMVNRSLCPYRLVGVGKYLSIAFMLMRSCVLRAVIGLGDRSVVTG